MTGATDWVRRALAELGPDAPDTEVKAYIRAQEPTVPERYVSLALRKIRGKVVRAVRKESRTGPRDAGPAVPPDVGGSS